MDSVLIMLVHDQRLLLGPLSCQPHSSSWWRRMVGLNSTITTGRDNEEQRKKQKLAKERAGLSKLPDLKNAEAVQKFLPWRNTTWWRVTSPRWIYKHNWHVWTATAVTASVTANSSTISGPDASDLEWEANINIIISAENIFKILTRKMSSSGRIRQRCLL